MFDDDRFRPWTEEGKLIPIHEVPLKRFILAHNSEDGIPHIADEEFCATTGREIAEGALERARNYAETLDNWRPTNVDGFSIAHTGSNWMNGVIAIREDATGAIVGGQCSGVPTVDPEYRGLKLGREIQLCAFETGLKTIFDGSFFSPEGLGARKSAHRFAVERALKQGLNVPKDVVEDYPDLAPSGPAFQAA